MVRLEKPQPREPRTLAEPPVRTAGLTKGVDFSKPQTAKPNSGRRSKPLSLTPEQERVFCEYRRYATDVARHMVSRKAWLRPLGDEVYQLAQIALVKAIQHYRDGTGTHLKTFIFLFVRQHLNAAARREYRQAGGVRRADVEALEAFGISRDPDPARVELVRAIERVIRGPVPDADDYRGVWDTLKRMGVSSGRMCRKTSSELYALFVEEVRRELSQGILPL
jgi:hypothetical protein